MIEPWLLQVSSENIGCWCGNKTTTKKHVKPTCFLNIFEKKVFTNQISSNWTEQYVKNKCEEALLPQKIIQTKCLPNTISREILTKKNVFFTSKMAKIETDES